MTGHKHKWKLVWTNQGPMFTGLWASAVWKGIYQCTVKRCGEMGYSA